MKQAAVSPASEHATCLQSSLVLQPIDGLEPEPVRVTVKPVVAAEEEVDVGFEVVGGGDDELEETVLVESVLEVLEEPDCDELLLDVELLETDDELNEQAPPSARF